MSVAAPASRTTDVNSSIDRVPCPIVQTITGSRCRGSIRCACSDPVLRNRTPVCRADKPAVSVCEDEDYRGGYQAADLKQNEHDVVAVQRECTDEHAAEEPHHPGPTTDTRGTVFLREVDDLRQVGEHRDHDSHAAEDCEHLSPSRLGHAQYVPQFAKTALVDS